MKQLSLKLFLVAAMLTAFLPIRAESQDGLTLFHKMQDALGGVERIAAVRDFEQSVQAQAWDNQGKLHGTVRKRVRWIRPNDLRIDQVGPDDSYVLYFDGTAGWEILPDKGLVDLAGNELNFAQGYLHGLNLNTWLADRDSDVVITSPRSNVIFLATKEDPSHGTEITLDPKTFLPIKQADGLSMDSTHPIRHELYFQEWRAIDGIKFPQRTSNFHDGTKVAEITVESTTLNSGLRKRDLARKPADLKPVMGGLKY